MGASLPLTVVYILWFISYIIVFWCFHYYLLCIFSQPFVGHGTFSRTVNIGYHPIAKAAIQTCFSLFTTTPFSNNRDDKAKAVHLDGSPLSLLIFSASCCADAMLLLCWRVWLVVANELRRRCCPKFGHSLVRVGFSL